jgi:hypothetical protein
VFILIKPDEDGNPINYFDTEADLAKYLDEAYGEDTRTTAEFKDAIWFSFNPDPNCWPMRDHIDTVVLIKGDVLVPRVVEVVRRFEF